MPTTVGVFKVRTQTVAQNLISIPYIRHRTSVAGVRERKLCAGDPPRDQKSQPAWRQSPTDLAIPQRVSCGAVRVIGVASSGLLYGGQRHDDAANRRARALGGVASGNVKSRGLRRRRFWTALPPNMPTLVRYFFSGSFFVGSFTGSFFAGSFGMSFVAGLTSTG